MGNFETKKENRLPCQGGHRKKHYKDNKDMKTSFIFLADGFEEVEALTSVDVMRRAGMPVVTVSINEGPAVTGAHGVTVMADSVFGDNDYSDAEWLVLPGGVPGAPNLAGHEALCELLRAHDRKGGYIGAICASPAVILAPLGLLDGRDAVCYPGMEVPSAEVSWKSGVPVAISGNVVTGNGPAAASPFALTMVAQSMGRAVADQVAGGMLLGPITC